MSPPELIDAALELLLSEGKVDAAMAVSTQSAPYDPGNPSPGYRQAWNHRLGWAEQDTPPPTLDHLLPLEMRQKCLDLWLATGTNVLYTTAQGMLGTFDKGGPDAAKLITDSLEADVFGRLDDLRTKWEGGQAA